jgi:hypothetical protein
MFSGWPPRVQAAIKSTFKDATLSDDVLESRKDVPMRVWRGLVVHASANATHMNIDIN